MSSSDYIALKKFKELKGNCSTDELGDPLSPSWYNVPINDNCDFLINNKSPKFGETFFNKNLAKVLKGIADNGKNFFYQGSVPKNIISYLDKFNGVLTEEDFYNHESEWVKPISINYKGYDVWECPPNGQGIAALIALNIYENFTDLDNEG